MTLKWHKSWKKISFHKGDSGGPFTTIEDGSHQLSGVISGDLSCSLPEYPSVFIPVFGESLVSSQLPNQFSRINILFFPKHFLLVWRLFGLDRWEHPRIGHMSAEASVKCQHQCLLCGLVLAMFFRWTHWIFETANCQKNYVLQSYKTTNYYIFLKKIYIFDFFF